MGSRGAILLNMLSVPPAPVDRCSWGLRLSPTPEGLSDLRMCPSLPSELQSRPHRVSQEGQKYCQSVYSDSPPRPLMASLPAPTLMLEPRGSGTEFAVFWALAGPRDIRAAFPLRGTGVKRLLKSVGAPGPRIWLLFRACTPAMAMGRTKGQGGASTLQATSVGRQGCGARVSLSV